MNHQAATHTLGDGLTGRGCKRAFARHFGEMVVAMLLGMVVLGGLAELAFALTGSSLSDQPAGFRIVLMGFNMTVPMAIWMGYRGHARPQNIEMAASMVVPTLAAAVLAWAGALGTGAGMAVQHAVMTRARPSTGG